jgi:hypothetical protein
MKLSKSQHNIKVFSDWHDFFPQGNVQWSILKYQSFVFSSKTCSFIVAGMYLLLFCDHRVTAHLDLTSKLKIKNFECSKLTT